MITPQDKALRSREATPFTRRFELCECSESAAAARQRVMKFRGLFRFGGNKIAQSGAMVDQQQAVVFFRGRLIRLQLATKRCGVQR